MEQKEIRPRPELGICPYIPPNILEGKLGQRQIVLSPCLGDGCAAFAGCQGEYSPRARALAERRFKSGVMDALGKLGDLIPGVSGIAARSAINAVRAAFLAAFPVDSGRVS